MRKKRQCDKSQPNLNLSLNQFSIYIGYAVAMQAVGARNYKAQAAHLVAYHPMVAVIGAGSSGEFCEEDQLCCARIAEILLSSWLWATGCQDSCYHRAVERHTHQCDHWWCKCWLSSKEWPDQRSWLHPSTYQWPRRSLSIRTWAGHEACRGVTASIETQDWISTSPEAQSCASSRSLIFWAVRKHCLPWRGVSSGNWNHC